MPDKYHKFQNNSLSELEKESLQRIDSQKSLLSVKSTKSQKSKKAAKRVSKAEALNPIESSKFIRKSLVRLSEKLSDF
jgi:hypothetical protein